MVRGGLVASARARAPAQRPRHRGGQRRLRRPLPARQLRAHPATLAMARRRGGMAAAHPPRLKRARAAWPEARLDPLYYCSMTCERCARRLDSCAAG